jgi:uncharacterized protein (DUF1501 family)
MHNHCDEYARSHAAAGRGLPMIEPGMPTPAGTGLTRRSMMLRSMGLGMAVYGGGLLSSADRVEAAINDSLGEHKVVISVYLSGGFDNLSTFLPFGNDHRHEADLATLRPTLWSGLDRGTTVPFTADESLSWHPSASGLRALWDDPDLGVAVAPAIGYTGANYSHFTGRHYWETGSLEFDGLTGWLGRYLDRVGKPNVPVQGITIGPLLNPALATANVPVASIGSIDYYRYRYEGAYGPLTDAVTRELRTIADKPSGDPARDQSRLVTGASFRLADNMAAAATTARSTATYPTEPSGFIDSLKDAARLLATRVNGAALPVRCITLQAHGGYDTHSAQAKTFTDNMRITTDGIRAFWDDIKARGEDDRVVMLVWSEFGRRPLENGSGGTDHGAAGTAFVIGKKVQQGLIGQFPGLKAYGATDSGLMRDGNLRATSDFRGVYSAILEQWLDTDAAGLIPGAGNRPGTGAFVRPDLVRP